MGIPSLTPTVDDLQWTLNPVPRLDEALSGNYLAQLSRDELIAYVADLREETSALRRTLHAAIATVAQLTAQLTRSRETIIRLQDNLREHRRAA